MPSFFNPHPRPFYFRSSLRLALALALAAFCTVHAARAQGEESIDDDTDPVKVFERAQNAHAAGDEENLKLALELYEQAIKLRPEFPEAEFQKGAALISLGRNAEAEKAYRRASELKPKWALPYAALGSLLARQKRDRDAEPALRRALELEPGNRIALLALADVRTRAGDKKESLTLLSAATSDEDVKASDWVARGEAERAAGDAAGAAKSFTRAVNMDPEFAPARVRRAELSIEAGDTDNAMRDLQAIDEAALADVRLALHIVSLYARMGRKEEAIRAFDALSEEAKKSDEGVALRTAIMTEGEETPEARAALESLLERTPRDASLHARLGALYRVQDPARSLQHYRTALELEPNNVDYATGFGAALVQARKFEEAARVLRQVVAAAPDNYAAHANLATAFNELKLYREAIAEYQWLNRARPELSIILFFIARAHDELREYPEALIFYETFLTKADAQANRLEIDKVNLRLPTLRNQIRLGEGVKKKKG